MTPSPATDVGADRHPGARALGLEPASVSEWRRPDLIVDPRAILRLARYRRPDAAPPAIAESARLMAERAGALVAARAHLRLVSVDRAGPDGVRLHEGATFSGRGVGGLLAGCRRAVAFVLTIGAALETEVVARAERRELLEAYFLDTAGWAAIEAAVRALRLDLVARGREEGRRVTHRLGPGHRDWPLEEQRALVALFDGAPPLVRLTEHSLLVPLKSVSGIFGVD